MSAKILKLKLCCILFASLINGQTFGLPSLSSVDDPISSVVGDDPTTLAPVDEPTCKFPFFRSGVWYEQCTLQPREKFWCPTKVDPATREQLVGDGSDSWTFCPDHLASQPADCPETYERMAGRCVRVSPAPLTWTQAEQTCREEGGHLLHVTSKELQEGVEGLIKEKMKTKDSFLVDKWSTGLTSEHDRYWIGGKVFRQNEWKWIGSRQNMSGFNNWEKGSEGQGCSPDCFDYSHRLAMNTRARYAWRAEDQNKAYPYICISDCAIGYSWLPTARRCVKQVDPAKGPKKQAEASVICAADHGRLLSINSCEEMDGLQQDLWLRTSSLTDTYWVGIFGGGFQNYGGQMRASETRDGTINSRGELGLKQGDRCPDNSITKLTGLGSAKDGYYGVFQFTSNKTAEIKFESFTKTDSETERGYLCEKETAWTCTEGFTLFQETCYRFHGAEVPLGTADQRCVKEGGRVTEVDTRLHATFLSAWLEQYSYQAVWLGHRRHTTTILTAEDTIYTSVSGEQLKEDGLVVADFQATSGTPDGPADDCLVMDRREGGHSGWRTEDCSNKASYVCQVDQMLSRGNIVAIPATPEILMPLDLVTGFRDYNIRKRKIIVSNVAITYAASLGNMLQGASHFSGRPESYLQIIPSTDRITTKYGLTVATWVYLDAIVVGDRQFILDASGPCTLGTEKYQSFLLWIEKSVPTPSGSPAPAPEPCGAITTTNPGAGGTWHGGPQEYIKLKALFCDGPLEGVTPVKDGTCSTFESAKSMPLTEEQWHHVGFSYDTFTKKGTFMIDQMFGYQGEGGKSMEGKHFIYNSSVSTAQSWLGEGSQGGFEGPIRIGSRKYSKERSWSGLVGRLSCLQLHSGGLSPAQVHHLASCPLDPAYLREMECPLGYQLFKNHCYRVSPREKTFAAAELDCSSGNGEVSVVVKYPQATAGWRSPRTTVLWSTSPSGPGTPMPWASSG